MPIPVACECGRSFKAKDELAGMKVRCPVCKTPLRVPKPESPADVEEEASALFLADSPEPEPSRSPRQTYARSNETGIRPPEPTSAPSRPSKKPPPRDDVQPPKKPRKVKRTGGGIAINGEIITGLLMMLGAVAWFFGGMALGRIFFYPAYLFVLGIGAVIKGFTGGD
jgi:hypothetical protein